MIRHISIAAIAAGCSSGPPASQLMASLLTSADSQRLYVSAEFALQTDPDEAPVELDDDARVVVSFRDQEVTCTEMVYHTFSIDLMGNMHPYTDISYNGQLAVDMPPQPGESITIALRGASGDDAPASTITIPELLALDPVPLFVSRSSDFAFTWSTIVSDPMSWYIQGDDVQATQGLIASDTGTATIPANTLALTPGTDVMTVAATLAVTRMRYGTIDPAFAGGFISFQDTVFADFASTP